MGKLEEKLSEYLDDPSNEGKLDDALDQFIEDNEDKTPNLKTNYVGIEVECYGPLKRRELQKRVLLLDLEDYTDIATDGSIRPPREGRQFHAYEIRLLIPEKELTFVLKKFGKLFQKARLKTNETCGLHIHLDMRNRSYENCLVKLRKFEDTLFALVAKHRWTSDFCKHSEFIDENRDTKRYSAINGESAYERHQTIEIRLHQGTVDTRKIEKWIRLLLNVINTKNVPILTSKKDVLKWGALDKQAKSYVRLNYKDGWANQKVTFYQQQEMRQEDVRRRELEDEEFRRRFRRDMELLRR